jgi:Protein of unknown function (DUF3237)
MTGGTTMSHDFQPILDYAFTIGIELTGARWIKPTSIGMTRAAVYAGSGTIEGPMLRGKVIPMSGGDFPLVRADGVIDFDARYLLEAEDGTVIYLQNRGYRWAKTPAAAEKMNRNEAVHADEYYMRVSPKFDAPDGSHAWLNKHMFVGVAEKIPGANRIHYFVVR